VARIKHGLQDSLALGNLDVLRDWGYAPDYVKAIWAMLRAPEPRDYVIATGIQHSVRELCDLAFAAAGLHWENHVHTDPRFIRPAEVNTLLGNPARAKAELGWAPTLTFDQMITGMVHADLHRVEHGITWHT
jgi:GDPmannose 4,6-dehydratase